MACSSFMLNSFCDYTIVILVFFDDLQFGFSVFTEMIRYLILSAIYACIVMKMLANVACVNKDILLSCVKCLFEKWTPLTSGTVFGITGWYF